MLSCPLILFTVFLSARGHAQAAQDGEFSVQRFEPSPGPRNYLSVVGGRTAGEWAWSAGMLFDYAHNPFVLRSCLSATDCDASNAVRKDDVHVVENMFTWNVMGSLTPIPRLHGLPTGIAKQTPKKQTIN